MLKRLLVLTAFTTLGLAGSAYADSKAYIVLLKGQGNISASFEKAVTDAGGTITTRIPELGAVGVSSDNPNFAATMTGNNSVEAINDDAMYQMIPTPEQMQVQAGPSDDAATQAPGPDTQTGPDEYYNRYQWDKKRIRASNQGSYSVQLGRPDVVVAVLDTGADVIPSIHPDLVGNLDVARSRSFVNAPNGDPNPAAWDDKNGHGTHCATSIGAPINGRGIVGVAPRITLVSCKVLSDTGSGSYLWLAQALVYAGVNHFDVASMSLGGYVDHSTNQATIKLVQRAVNFARENGVTPVAALGNNNFDLSDGHFMGDFIDVPAEIDGVIGVSATNFSNQKASYSNYGVGKADMSAPGGDNDIPAPFGYVLAGWAQDSIVFPVVNPYVFAAGTSMACPQVAGTAALIISQYGDFTPSNGRKPHMSPQQVEQILAQTANNQPCPAATTCDGGSGYNNYFGKGIVDAFKAVTGTK
jgi:subtilisin family serine protease